MVLCGPLVATVGPGVMFVFSPVASCGKWDWRSWRRRETGIESWAGDGELAVWMEHSRRGAQLVIVWLVLLPCPLLWIFQI